MVINYLRNHLKLRNLQLERYNHVSVDDENEVVTFPLWNLSGQMVGYQQYRPWGSKSVNNDRETGKYYQHIPFGKIGVWGVETLSYNPHLVFMCEGKFDACQIHNFELPAIAVLGNNPLHLVPWLKALGRKVIAIPDDDVAGVSLGKLAHEVLSVAPFLEGVNHGSRDLGRLSPEQVKILLSSYLP